MVGNSNSNINNVGFVAKAGEWIVYSNFDDNNYLYKMKADGSMKIKLAEVSCKYINISDDWIYYTDFWGVNIYITNINDGKTDIVVGDNYIGKHITNWVYDEVSEEISHLIVVDDWMNWTQFNGESLMCKNIFTYEEYRLRNRISYYLNMEGEWAFYLKEADCSYGPKMEFDMMYLGGIDNTMLDKANYKLSLKRISFEIPDIIFNFIVEDEVAYYSSEIGIYKTTLRDGKTVKLSKNRSRKFIISGDDLFYINCDDSSKLYKINLHNMKESKVSDIDNIRAVNIIDNQIYYYIKTTENKLALYRMGTDGSKSTLV